MTTTHTATTTTRSATTPDDAATHAPSVHTLDELLGLDAERLEALYRNARVPRIQDVRGALRGRMLTIPKLPAALVGPIRAFASSRRFPWRGKTFRPHHEHKGEGINRVVSEAFELYRFETFVGRSRAGDFDAVQLDYDLPTNPFFIRAIKDEIREIAPGLWLGQAYAQVRGKAHLVLYFGLTDR